MSARLRTPTVGAARLALKWAIARDGHDSPAVRAARGRVDAFLGELNSDDLHYRVAWKRQKDRDGYSNRSSRRYFKRWIAAAVRREQLMVQAGVA